MTENSEISFDNNNYDCKENLKHCLSLCHEYFGGVWKNTNTTDLTFKYLSDGFVNTTFVCSLKEQSKMKNNDSYVPSKVIYKKYGNKTSFKDIMRACNSETEEALIAQMLGIQGISPLLYGIFDGGRLEEFIEGKTLTTNDLNDKEIVKSAARQIARLHSLKMPLKKSPDLLTNFEMQFILVDLNKDLSKYDEHNQFFVKKLLNFNLKEEGKWFKEKLAKLNSPLIFTHNDFSLNNIIKVKGRKEKVLLIDFDRTCYHYRGRDLSYFLTFSKHDIKRENELPIVFVAKNYDDTIRQTFLQEYLDELKKMKVKKSDDLLDVADSIEEMDFEISFFELLVCLEMIAFAYWSIKDDKDYLFIGAESFCTFADLYNKRKLDFIAKYQKFNL